MSAAKQTRDLDAEAREQIARENLSGIDSPPIGSEEDLRRLRSEFAAKADLALTSMFSSEAEAAAAAATRIARTIDDLRHPKYPRQLAEADRRNGGSPRRHGDDALDEEVREAEALGGGIGEWLGEGPREVSLKVEDGLFVFKVFPYGGDVRKSPAFRSARIVAAIVNGVLKGRAEQ